MEVLSTGALPLHVMLRRLTTARTPRHRPLRAQRRRPGYLEPACTLRRRQTSEQQISRIREQLRRRPPPSSYDTAWVAMVPAQGAPQAPRFPRFVDWIMENQHDDGSWGLGHRHLPSLGKEAISTTLACVLALKKWNVGEEHIKKGLCFIGNSSSYILDARCDMPVGFDIIFPCMIRFGIELGLEFPLAESDIDEILRLRNMELESRSMAPGRKAYMAYIAEGLGDIQDWDEILTYQSRNGSLFNSPSATAAVAIHSHNANALKYLELLARKFGSSAATVYPQNIYSQLSLIDTLEKMGISGYFSCEINSILDMTYRSWLRNDEEVIMDMETCALAFRILRVNGYDVSSDVLSDFAEESRFHNSVQGYLNDTKTLLELHKASLVRILEDELILDNIGSWTSKLLKQQLCSRCVPRSVVPQEVEYVLKFPFCSTTVEPLEHKRNIEHFNFTKGIQMRKSAYLASHATQEILSLAIDEFNSSQSLYQQELKCIESWVKEVRLDQLKFARVMPSDIWVFMASTVFPSELSDARVTWIKNVILTIVLDDFFDGGGSTEELENLITLIQKWDTRAGNGFCSEHVEILFLAIYKTNNQIGEKAAKVQNRSVVDHIAEVWANLARSFMAEAEWARKKYVPAMEEYMSVAEVSYAQGPILVASLYLVGPELSDDMVRSPEYKDLLRHTSICGRLLNDLCTHEKESAHGYVNSVLLHAHRHRHGGLTLSASTEAAKREIRKTIVVSQRELLSLVLREGSAIPRPCREVFWNTYKVSHMFYSQGDGFCTLQELMAAANAVVHEPLQVTLPSCSDMP